MLGQARAADVHAPGEPTFGQRTADDGVRWQLAPRQRYGEAPEAVQLDGLAMAAMAQFEPQLLLVRSLQAGQHTDAELGLRSEAGAFALEDVERVDEVRDGPGLAVQVRGAFDGDAGQAAARWAQAHRWPVPAPGRTALPARWLRRCASSWHWELSLTSSKVWFNTLSGHSVSARRCC